MEPSPSQWLKEMHARCRTKMYSQMFLVFIPKKLLFCQTDRTPVVTIKAIKITDLKDLMESLTV